jgi:hypothetical protein
MISVVIPWRFTAIKAAVVQANNVKIPLWVNKRHVHGVLL